MKKYWKLMLLAACSIMLLGAHYIQSARALNDYVSLKINTVSGDESVVEHIKLHGYYNDAPFFLTASASLQDEVTPVQGLHVYSLFESHSNSELKNYVEQYRGFMRGKLLNRLVYFEDEQRLLYAQLGEMDVYADVNELTFHIESLTKDNKKEQKFSVTAPTKYPYRWAAIENVQVVDGAIHLMLYTSTQNGSGLQHFVIDEAKQQIIDHKQVALIEMEENYYDSILFMHTAAAQKMTNFSYYTEKRLTTEQGPEENGIIQLYNYNILTQQVEEIELPVAKQSLNYYTATDEAIYIAVFNDRNGLDLHTYTHATQSWTVTPLEDSSDFRSISIHEVDGYIYVTAEKADDHVLHVYNTQTGELLYKGHIINRNELAKDYYFQTELITN